MDSSCSDSSNMKPFIGNAVSGRLIEYRKNVGKSNIYKKYLANNH